jgi:putative addiction module component (TIGR02574 family)
MPTTIPYESLLEGALALPPDKRAALAEALNESLATMDEDIEASHLREIDDRLRAIDAGEMGTIPAEDVLRELRGE